MIELLSDFAVHRSNRRRSSRFRAVIEVLDSRQLMATGITGIVNPVTGTSGLPLPVLIRSDNPDINGTPAPIGTPIPLVTLTNSSTSTLATTGYAGTVDWGDASPIDPAVFIEASDSVSQSPSVNQLIVNGPEHTYILPGIYAITVSVSAPGDTAPTVYHSTATIVAPVPNYGLLLTGQLNPLSDTGSSNSDYVTANNTPNFFGVTEPGLTVLLYATSAATNQILTVGSGVADSFGVWRITTVPFVNGSYVINAQSFGTNGENGPWLHHGTNPQHRLSGHR